MRGAIRSAVAEGSSSGSPRRIRRIPSLGPSLPRLTSRRNTQESRLHSTTIPQPSFVSNPRAISTQPSHIRDSPDPTQLQPQQDGGRGKCAAQAKRHRRGHAANEFFSCNIFHALPSSFLSCRRQDCSAYRSHFPPFVTSTMLSFYQRISVGEPHSSLDPARCDLELKCVQLAMPRNLYFALTSSSP